MAAKVYPAPALEERMRDVVALARENIEQGTGGPFGAAVFECATGRLVAAGVNLVAYRRCALMHAEMTALMLAQDALGCYSFKDVGAYELVTSVEPCAMCLGALGWAGLTRVVCGARDADARGIGFDEGDKPAEGLQVLAKHGIDVVTDVLRDEARAVLETYRQRGGLIY